MNWIELIHTDENKALKLLYKSHRNDIIRWLKSHYKMDEDIGIDIFQQSVIILYDNVISGKVTKMSCDVKSYLFGVCKNKAREHIRDLRRQNEIKHQYSFLSNENNDNCIEEKKDLEKYIDLMNDFLQILGHPCKKILELFYYKRQNMDQICDTLGYKNVNTTKNQKYKCIKRLQSMVTKHTIV